MKLVKWEPKRGWDVMKDFFDLEKGLEGLIHFPLTLSGKSGSTDMFDRGWAPAINVQDLKKEVIVKVNVPGLKKEELDVVVEGNCLVVRGEKREEKQQKGKKQQGTERLYAAFEEAVTLPSWVNEAKAAATCKGGVLSIRMPKIKGYEPKHVHVRVA